MTSLPIAAQESSERVSLVTENRNENPSSSADQLISENASLRARFRGLCILLLVSLFSVASFRRPREYAVSSTVTKDCTIYSQNQSAFDPIVIPADAAHGPAEMQRNLSCNWAPGKDSECLNLLQELNCRNRKQGENSDRVRRTILLGDSTMKRLFRFGSFQNSLISGKAAVISRLTTGRVKCRSPKTGRCNLNTPFGLPYPENKAWRKPLPRIEGPLVYGLETPFCQDCAGCESVLLECIPSQDDLDVSTFDSNEKQQLVYGSFFGVEFARDAEMQSTLFQTTQENLAYYLNKTWNSHEALLIWEKPTCIVNSGSHDIGIRAITRDLFVSNVKWYTSLLAEQCDTIIWIATTSPRSDDENIQSKGATLSWNSAVQKMLEETPVLQDKSAFIDVFEPSITYKHVDNIHMDDSWYAALSKLFKVGMYKCSS